MDMVGLMLSKIGRGGSRRGKPDAMKGYRRNERYFRPRRETLEAQGWPMKEHQRKSPRRSWRDCWLQ